MRCLTIAAFAILTGCCSVSPIGLGFLHGLSLIPDETYESQIQKLESECSRASVNCSGASPDSSCPGRP